MNPKDLITPADKLYVSRSDVLRGSNLSIYISSNDESFNRFSIREVNLKKHQRF